MMRFLFQFTIFLLTEVLKNQDYSIGLSPKLSLSLFEAGRWFQVFLTSAKVAAAAAAAALFAAGISGIIPSLFEKMSGESGPTSDAIVRPRPLLYVSLPA